MKKKVWIGIGLVVAAIAWYAFRPELLFVNKSVSESFPAANRCCQHSRLRGEAKAVGDGTVHDLDGKSPAIRKGEHFVGIGGKSALSELWYVDEPAC